MKVGLTQALEHDRELVRIVDAASAEAVRRSGPYVVCRPGCAQCCYGPFAITMLDAIRLRDGLRALEAADPQRANRIRARAAEYIKALSNAYPGDAGTGILKPAGQFPPAFDNVPCPALDPDTRCCDLYDSRPITCRTFGPAAAQADGSIGACELCYAGASDEEIAACVVESDPDGLESDLLAALEAGGMCGETIVAYALALPW